MQPGSMEQVQKLSSQIHHAILRKPDPAATPTEDLAYWTMWLKYTVSEVLFLQVQHGIMRFPRYVVGAAYEYQKSARVPGYEFSGLAVKAIGDKTTAAQWYDFALPIEGDDDGAVPLLKWEEIDHEWIDSEFHRSAVTPATPVPLPSKKRGNPPGIPAGDMKRGRSDAPLDAPPLKRRRVTARMSRTPRLPRIEVPSSSSESEEELTRGRSTTPRRKAGRRNQRGASKPRSTSNASSQRSIVTRSQSRSQRPKNGTADGGHEADRDVNAEGAETKKMRPNESRKAVEPERYFPEFPNSQHSLPVGIISMNGPYKKLRCAVCVDHGQDCIISPFTSKCCLACITLKGSCSITKLAHGRLALGAYLLYRVGVQLANPDMYPNPIFLSKAWLDRASKDVPDWFYFWYFYWHRQPAKVIREIIDNERLSSVWMLIEGQEHWDYPTAPQRPRTSRNAKKGPTTLPKVDITTLTSDDDLSAVPSGDEADDVGRKTRFNIAAVSPSNSAGPSIDVKGKTKERPPAFAMTRPSHASPIPPDGDDLLMEALGNLDVGTDVSEPRPLSSETSAISRRVFALEQQVRELKEENAELRRAQAAFPGSRELISMVVQRLQQDGLGVARSGVYHGADRNEQAALRESILGPDASASPSAGAGPPSTIRANPPPHAGRQPPHLGGFLGAAPSSSVSAPPAAVRATAQATFTEQSHSGTAPPTRPWFSNPGMDLLRDAV
ncbi:uncharacterized protein BXZ73DRAFT_76401 [Epithele typhae]|uniref:uncharacterized protein n=1 Tax=Epithele typhae TaxID=378194 RepID=UPI0020085CBC|nr:uncharacterized protein BXZ73DRAFT_76401 [Epithele typhae]KAH9938908.1 hypothetical protein BXZ73DRAFT_76401 [Epithele typhae]